MSNKLTLQIGNLHKERKELEQLMLKLGYRDSVIEKRLLEINNQIETISSNV